MMQTYNYSSLIDAEVVLSGPIGQTRYGIDDQLDQAITKLFNQTPEPKQLTRRTYMRIVGQLQADNAFE
jgi:hypothetical protein